jgi:xanthine dehydrogenase accessory factor
MPGVYSLLIEYTKANKPVAVATALTPPFMGAKMLVPGGSELPTVGSIHATLDTRIATDALAMLAEGRNSTVTYELDGEPVEVFIETFPTARRLIIVGAVHVAIPLHALGHMLGYHVTVIDARGMLASKERFPVADEVLAEWPDEAMDRLGLDANTSVVVLAHDPKFDHPALAAALRSEAQYIGAIGSRGTIRQREDALREIGFTPEQLGRIHGPIGLDIGAQTPAEIALAIMAEVVAARNSREGGHLRAPATGQASK